MNAIILMQRYKKLASPPSITAFFIDLSWACSRPCCHDADDFFFTRLDKPMAPVGQTRRHRWQPTHLLPIR